MAGSAPPTGALGGTAYPTNARNGTDIWEDSGTTTVLTAPIIGTTAGSPNVILAATAGKKIRVLGVNFTSAAAGTVQFQDTAGSPVLLSGVYTLAANGMVSLSPNEFGYMDTNAGVGLNIAVTGTTNVVGGTITYCLH